MSGYLAKPVHDLERWMTDRYNCLLATEEGAGGWKVVDHYAWDGCPACDKGPVVTYADGKAVCRTCGLGAAALLTAALERDSGNKPEEALDEDTWAPVDVGTILDAIERGEVIGVQPTMLPRTDG